jgi:CRISPR system Cascade subunit CasA
MAEFNLIEKPWIPCIDPDGKLAEYGIRDTLLKAHKLREIYDDSPLVTLAIHRLLLAILYRSLSGPTAFSDWEKWYGNGAFDKHAIEDYLNDWKSSFDLLAEDKPFYQMGRFETSKPISVNRLSTESASGNNTTLFDHCEDNIEVKWTRAQAAKSLVACQSFALGFGRSGNAHINGIDETLPYSTDAIALRGMSIWLQGNSLFETLILNLVPVNDSSLPPWELKDSNQYRDRLKGKDRVVVTAFGIVDRLTWQSRLVKLISKDSTISKMFFTQGRSADKSAGDPMKVYRMSKEEGISALSLSSSKAAWRDAHSIFLIPSDQSNEHRPECFNLVARAQSSGVMDTSRLFVTHIVGLASAPKKAGKFLFWRHERMPIPVTLLNSENLIERLGMLLKNAENAADGIENRSWRICKLYLSPDCESLGAHQPDKTDIAKVVKTIDACPAFWARLEEHFFALLENLPNDWDYSSDGWKPENQQYATLTWRKNIKDEAQRALEESIQSLGTTARAIQAVARVRTDFNDNDFKPPSQKTDKPKEKSKGGKKK